MTEHRVIDLAEHGVHVHLDTANLVIDHEGEEYMRVPVEDVAAVVISHPRITVTKAALAACAEGSVGFVVCDDYYMPVGMLLPLQAHYIQAARFAGQVAASLPTRKRLWQDIVRCKIRSQAKTLVELRGTDAGLYEMVQMVRSGDPENVEAQAARRYWPILIANSNFVRDRYGPWPNPALNYGYAVLRALTARAIAASGLHPSLGLHHHNQYDAFRLADDLMEPLRPMVDRAIVTRLDRERQDNQLQRQDKLEIVGALYERIEYNGESRTLFDLLSRMASSLAEVFMGTSTKMILPHP